MPQFRFRVATPDGRVRSGRFTGMTLEEVRKQIEESGLIVLELAPIENSSECQPRPIRRGQWLERISGYWVAAALASLGLVWGLLNRNHPGTDRPRPARDAIAMADRPFQADFLPSWQGPTGSDGARLVYRFPEIPYQVEQKWPSNQACIKFLAARQPTYCVVEVQSTKGILASARIEPIMKSNRFALTGAANP